MRHIPPAVLPSDLSELINAAFATHEVSDPRAALRAATGRDVAGLFDSGTSALLTGIQTALSIRKGLVAIPSYGCIDVPTAVKAASARAIGYDINTDNLAPSLESIDATISAGATVVVVSHLFGHPVDLSNVKHLCQEKGVLLIEDAAQWAGGSINGAPLVATGDWSILSLGRGKGFVGTGGGVLFSSTETSAPEATIGSGKDPVRLAKAIAASILGQPTLYSIPASLPFLKLGEMVYHEPHEPRQMSILSMRLIPGALAKMEARRKHRQSQAELLIPAAEKGGHSKPYLLAETANAGWLRLALHSDGRPIPNKLGVVKPYPLHLYEQKEILDILEPAPFLPVGAMELADRLITLPLHHRLTDRDIHSLREWLAQQ